VPELPEVETVRLGLQRQTQDFLIGRVEVLRDRAIAAPPDPALFRLALEGCRIEQWSRRGKYLLAELRHPDGQQAGIWGVHLRMTGQFLWLGAPEGARCGPAGDSDPGQHTRVRIWEQSGAELRFIDTRSFAQMWFVPPGRAVESVITGLARLGPEPFDPGFSANYLQERLRGSRRPIKSALLDQSLVAGIGNIYADESLFAAGILPQTVSDRLGSQRLERLRGAVVEILQTSIGAGGTTFSDFRDLTGTNGNYGGQAWVYRRGGLPCRRCGTPLMRDRLAGRSTHWCPCCQK
jgi:formamidopyrimidine-DNA glycosylase